MVVYGAASGPADPLNVGVLAKGSFYVTFGHFFCISWRILKSIGIGGSECERPQDSLCSH